ncbi:hypothetical protein NP233_g3739 [Leucocoprinus birnbaumii]|uniref:F-box domain-containing protein n=1 Tax=Leucocoprinus birnbaumii TaxID=56174 RepID=A0AAD5VXE9_9AGAR|nr:hypothetical protein NP233_g3739 [Leucocoprinus birnbaumii]
MPAIETETLALLDKMISSLNLNIDSLLSERARLCQRVNALRALINALPIEMLIEILEWTCTDAFTPSSSLKTLLTMSAVCTHWRNVVWSTPCFWTLVDFRAFPNESYAIQLLNLYLTNSRNSPLSFILPLSGSPHAENTATQALYQSGFSILRSLDLSLTPKQPIGEHPFSFLRAPKLTSVTLHRPPITLEYQLSLTNVTALRLINTCPGHAIRIMIQCPRLVEFSLVRDWEVARGLAAVESIPSFLLNEEVTFPDLKKYTWRYSKQAIDTSLLRYIRLPSVYHLHFDVPMRNLDDFRPVLASMTKLKTVTLDLNANTVNTLALLPSVEDLTISGGLVNYSNLSQFFERLADGKRVLPQLLRLDIRSHDLIATHLAAGSCIENMLAMLAARRGHRAWVKELEKMVVWTSMIDQFASALTIEHRASLLRLSNEGLRRDDPLMRLIEVWNDFPPRAFNRVKNLNDTPWRGLMRTLPKTMHRVLGIPELLDTIFRLLDDKSNFSNALVCHAWSEIALDTLWRHVNNLHRLFNLLSPLQERDDGSRKFEFTRFPGSDDWKKFQKYAKRVRVLEYDEEKQNPALSQSVFDDIARTRTSFAILPNVHTISWNAPLLLCVMFMYSNVKRFAIHLPNLVEDASPEPFFNDIINRMPRLTHIDIRTEIPVRKLEKDTIRLLSSLPNLQKITTPRFFFTSAIAICLSRLSKLGCIEFQYYDEQGYGDPSDVAVFRPELEEGAFPALWDLSVTASYTDVQRFLTIPFAPTNLTLLYVESYTFETPTAIHQLLTAISENSQMLKQLTLISPRRPREAAEVPLDNSHKVTINTLKPVFGCGNLTMLEIIHQYPLMLRQKDLELFAKRWPSLETLNLNTEPHIFESSDMTLEALFPFAQHCPHLTYLGLFVDASVGRLPASSPSTTFPIFKRLQKLAMGISVIGEYVPVASFLSQVLPAGCQIESGIIWDETFRLDRLDGLLAERYHTWGEVNKLLPTLIQVRMEERQRTDELRRELSEVKERVKKLTEKLEGSVGPIDVYDISL